MIFNPIIPANILVVFAVIVVGIFIFCLAKKSRRRTTFMRRIGMLALVLVILARPMVPDTSENKTSANFNVYFAVDMTGSMVAKDYDNQTTRRYEKVIADIKQIAQTFPNAKYTIMVEDYACHTELPLSSSLSELEKTADALKPKTTVMSTGSDLNALLNYVSSHMDTYRARQADQKNVLFVFSDGEDTKSQANISDTLKTMLASGAVFGYGSDNGIQIEQIGHYNEILENNFVYYADDNHQNAGNYISKINETKLNEVANAAGIVYLRRTDDGIKTADLNTIAEKAAANDHSLINYVDTYWIFSLILLSLLLWEFATVLNKLLLERKPTK